jgi:hypothetical protein
MESTAIVIDREKLEASLNVLEWDLKRLRRLLGLR